MRYPQPASIKCVFFCWTMSVLMFDGSLADESFSGDGVQFLRNAAAVHASDWERLKSCSGSGNMVCITRDKTSTWTSDIQFEINEQKLWQQMVTENSEPVGFRDVDRVEILADGDVICNVSWSSRFRPSGCKIYVREDDQDGIFAASSGDRIDIRRDICPVFLRSRSEESFTRSDRHATVESNSDSQCTVVVTYTKDGSFLRYVFSREWAGRLTRMEQFDELSQPVRIFEYEWMAMDGEVQPRTITLEEFEYGSKAHSSHTYIFVIDKLVDKSTGRQFLLSETKVCEGARLIDYRRETTSPVRTFTTLTNDAKSMSEEVSQMPERGGDKLPDAVGRVTPEGYGLATILLCINCAVLSIGACIWLYNYRRKNV